MSAAEAVRAPYRSAEMNVQAEDPERTVRCRQAVDKRPSRRAGRCLTARDGGDSIDNVAALDDYEFRIAGTRMRVARHQLHGSLLGWRRRTRQRQCEGASIDGRGKRGWHPTDARAFMASPKALDAIGDALLAFEVGTLNAVGSTPSAGGIKRPRAKDKSRSMWSVQGRRKRSGKLRCCSGQEEATRLGRAGTCRHDSTSQ
jgi:hypothetical protein